jgi:tetratricopeptide (TPR) repeat protein
MGRPEAEQRPLRAALDAAAVLHWFDGRLLEKLLGVSQEEGLRWVEILQEYSFVERYHGKIDDRFNLHESTRLGWRMKFASERLDQFRDVSARAALCFADSNIPSDRIEWIYHLLCGDPDVGASNLEKLDREWTTTTRLEDRYALASALQELLDTDLLQARARSWALLFIAWRHLEDRGEVAEIGGIASEILKLAEVTQDTRALAQARLLEGEVLLVRGNWPEAQRACAQGVALFHTVVEQNRNDAGLRHDLAVAYNKLGNVHEIQRNFGPARKAFEQSFAIFQSMAERDPSNPARQRDLSVAYSRIGGMFQAQHRLPEAQEAFNRDLAISQGLVEKDPSNAAWKRDLALTYLRVGGVLKAQAELEAAERAFDQSIAIFGGLAEKDPSNARYQRGLGRGLRGVGDILRTQGKLEGALIALGKCLVINQSLVGRDPSNADWQQDLALALGSMGEALQDQGNSEAAQIAFSDSRAIWRRLTNQRPGLTALQDELTNIEAKLAALH